MKSLAGVMLGQKLNQETRQWRGGLRMLLCAVLLAMSSSTSMAGDEHDHDRARQALAAGEILPLRIILERVERDYPGQVLDVELEQHEQQGAVRWVYEIKLLQRGGARIKLKVDARDGTVIQSRQNGRHGEKP